MAEKLHTIKVTRRTIINLNIASAFSGKKQWEMAEKAAKAIAKESQKKKKP